MDTDDGGLEDRAPTVGYERWRVTVPAGAERPTSAAEWSDALVIVEQGVVEVVCRGGARRAFGEGSYLCLSWLAVECLRNRGSVDVVIAAVRRSRGDDGSVGVPYPA